jgi:hypothetical protein
MREVSLPVTQPGIVAIKDLKETWKRHNLIPWSRQNVLRQDAILDLAWSWNSCIGSHFSIKILGLVTNVIVLVIFSCTSAYWPPVNSLVFPETPKFPRD